MTTRSRVRRRLTGPRQLQVVLRTGDAIAMFIGFAVPLMLVAAYGPRTAPIALLESAVLTAIGLWAMRLHGLWSVPVIAVRSVEVSQIFRALATLSALALVLDRKSPTDLRVGNLVRRRERSASSSLSLWRSVYRAFLNAERRRGRYTSRVAVVGTGRQANELSRLFVVHPELGMRVTTVIGARAGSRGDRASAHLWQGDVRRGPRRSSAGLDVDVVVLCSAELDRWHAQRSVSAIARPAAARSTSIPACPASTSGGCTPPRSATSRCSRCRAPSLSGLQAGIKRAFDIAVAGPGRRADAATRWR